jgi:hypothetical protein
MIESGLQLLPQSESVSLLGVDYTHFKTVDGSDLYLTRFGSPFVEHLAPQNWYATEWFAAHRVRLQGTSTIYRIPTKPVNGRSLNLVVRFSRVGQDVPLDPRILNEHPDAEFNSPLEEFALAMELRQPHKGRSRPCIWTKKPLAIYVPSTRLADWQTGRVESKMAAKLARHPEIKLDIARQYLVVYGWIKGLNAVEAAQVIGMSGAAGAKFLAETTWRAVNDLKDRGFRMLDMKPEHVVLRVLNKDSLLRCRSGEPAYALVDYELLERIV